MAAVPAHISQKLRNASARARDVRNLSIRHANSAPLASTAEISVAAGEMAQLQRSALNYCMWDFAEQNLKPVIPADEYAKLAYSHDFPIETTSATFHGNPKTRMLKHLVSAHPKMYAFLESVQPFNDGMKTLDFLRVLSNDSSHTTPVEAIPMLLEDIDTSMGKPVIVAGGILVPKGVAGHYREYRAPCYAPEFGLVYTKRGKWVLYLVDLGSEKKPNLLRYAAMAEEVTSGIVNEFYKLW